MLGPLLFSSEKASELDLSAGQMGISGRTLMAAAARAVAREITRDFAPCNVWVLCGPGNNGGDGLLIAHRLARAGWHTTVVSQPSWRDRRGDAQWAANVWGRTELSLDQAWGLSVGLIVDAAFGAGLNRPLDAELSDLFERVSGMAIPVIAVDVPSGVNGTSGDIEGGTVRATKTVTFVRPKIGHVLLPGRAYAGDIVVADIGIPSGIVCQAKSNVCLNSPALWADQLPQRGPSSNKYDAGHAVVLGGPRTRTGAATMTAMAADKGGAGLVTLGCSPEDVPSYESRLLEVMLRSIASADDLATWLDDRRISALAIGPAFGMSEQRAKWLEIGLQTSKPIVIDADAISILAARPERLRERLHAAAILTPHDGEFSRISNAQGSRLDRARQTASETGAIVVLKGGDTVIASPTGDAVITAHAPPSLAKAGSGDILSGIILGLLAQNMRPFEAACAGVWLHGEAARWLSAPLSSQIVSTDALDRAMASARRLAIAEPAVSP